MLKYILSFMLLFSTLSVFAGGWEEDVLGNGYICHHVAQPDDYSGKVRTTVIRKRVQPQTSVAILYVHGYNDYFFQSELGDSVQHHGMAFYAVDLRKYGRSLMPGQLPFEVRDMQEYFADIDVALAQIKFDGYSKVILMGHSTGGLTISYYMKKHRTDRNQIFGMVLNSPFLDMNLSWLEEEILVPLISIVPFPDISIPQGDSRSYAESLLKKYKGEWSYNTEWKKEISPAVTVGWLTAIHNAQMDLREDNHIDIPILLMHSDKSVWGDVWTPDFSKGDSVLDVADISLYGKKLGNNVTELVVADGLHDLILSRKDVRDFVYRKMFLWMNYALH